MDGDMWSGVVVAPFSPVSPLSFLRAARATVPRGLLRSGRPAVAPVVLHGSWGSRVTLGGRWGTLLFCGDLGAAPFLRSFFGRVGISGGAKAVLQSHGIPMPARSVWILTLWLCLSHKWWHSRRSRGVWSVGVDLVRGWGSVACVLCCAR